MTCPVCAAQSQPVLEKNGYVIIGCASCGHRHTAQAPPAHHVSDTYGDSYFFGGGAGYQDYLSEGELLRRHGARYAALLQSHQPPGRLLDVGAAGGFVLQGFTAAGWDGHGIEPNRRMAAHAREQLGLDVTEGTLEDLPRDQPYDLITMIQVVAHFPDIQRAVAAAALATAPHGWWLIETWDCGSLTARAFGGSWHEYSPPSVLHWFTRRSLQLLAAQHGFDQVATGRPKKFLNAGHAKSLLRHALGGLGRSRLFDLTSRLLPDRVQLPYPAEDLFWSLFRRRPD